MKIEIGKTYLTKHGRFVRMDERILGSVFNGTYEKDGRDVVIDPVAGSGSTLIAAERLGRKAYGFEIKKDFYLKAKAWLEEEQQIKKDIAEYGFARTKVQKQAPILF